MAQQRAQTHEPDAAAAEAATPEAKQGPGVQALEALLQQGGVPEPDQVVAILDAHRGERDAIFQALHQTLGNAYVQRVIDATSGLRASLDRREVVAGDPSDPQGGFFVASQAEQGARWRTSGGGFTGKVDKQGLDSRVRLDDDDALHAHVGSDRSGTLGWEHAGRTEGELFGSFRGGDDHELGLRRAWGLDAGTLTTGVRDRVQGGTRTDSVFGDFKSTDGKTTASGALGIQDGGFAGSLGATRQLGANDKIAGSIAHDPNGTTLSASGSHGLAGGGTIDGRAQLHHGADGTTGSIAGASHHGGTAIDGSFTHGADADKLHLGATQQVSPELRIAGHADHEHRQAGDQTTAGVSERFRSSGLAHDLALDAGTGTRDFVGLRGSMDARLAPNLFAGAFGDVRAEHGKQTEGHLGASLTFTPNEKTALTVAGIVDQNGVLETRLQLDVFRKKVESVGDLADHKKDALVSLFVSYSQAQSGSMLDDRFGSSQLGATQQAGESRVMGGIRIKF